MEHAAINTFHHSIKEMNGFILKFWFFDGRTLAIEKGILFSA